MRDLNFEKWFCQHCGLNPDYVDAMWTGTTYRHYKWSVEGAGAAWNAALDLRHAQSAR